MLGLHLLCAMWTMEDACRWIVNLKVLVKVAPVRSLACIISVYKQHILYIETNNRSPRTQPSHFLGRRNVNHSLTLGFYLEAVPVVQPAPGIPAVEPEARILSSDTVTTVSRP